MGHRRRQPLFLVEDVPHLSLYHLIEFGSVDGHYTPRFLFTRKIIFFRRENVL